MIDQEVSCLEWQAQAVCFQAEDSSPWDMEGNNPTLAEIAKAGCSRCPVLQQCRARVDAMEGSTKEASLACVYAGETPRERVSRRRRGQRTLNRLEAEGLLSECKRCERPTRSPKVLAEDAPGYLCWASKSLCAACGVAMRREKRRTEEEKRRLAEEAKREREAKKAVEKAARQAEREAAAAEKKRLAEETKRERAEWRAAEKAARQAEREAAAVEKRRLAEEVRREREARRAARVAAREETRVERVKAGVAAEAAVRHLKAGIDGAEREIERLQEVLAGQKARLSELKVEYVEAKSVLRASRLFMKPPTEKCVLCQREFATRADEVTPLRPEHRARGHCVPCYRDYLALQKKAREKRESADLVAVA